jgi:hypothetical protein
VSEPVRVLVTGCGGPAAVGFTRSLAKTGSYRTVGTDANVFALPFAETEVKYLVPPVGSADFLDVLNRVIADEGIDFVHAQPDAEVLFLSRVRDQLAAPVFLPAQASVELCHDKYLSTLRWAAAGVVVPQTLLLTSPDDLRAAFFALAAPLWVRATTGAGGRGSLVGRDFDGAKAWIDLHRGWGHFTASELLPGRLLTWQSLWSNGELVCAQSRERLSWAMGGATMSGVSGMTGVARTVRRADLDLVAEAAVRAIDERPHGVFGVDLKENADGLPCPTEINIGRFFTTIQFFTELGLNLPDVYLRVARGMEPEGIGSRYNPLPPDWYWLRAADTPPVLISGEELVRSYSRYVDPAGLLADTTVTYAT